MPEQADAYVGIEDDEAATTFIARALMTGVSLRMTEVVALPLTEVVVVTVIVDALGHGARGSTT